MKRAGVLAAALVALFALGACGGDSDDAEESPGTATSPAGETPSAAASPSGTAPSGSATPALTGVLGEFAALEIPADLVDGFRLGEADAPVTLTLFEDFQCPFCLAFNLEFEDDILHDYVEEGTVLLEFKNYPILGPESTQAARATVCAADQGVFWQFHNRLFLEQALAGQLSDEQLNVGRFADDRLSAMAVESGADAEAFRVCMAAGSTLAAVQTQYVEAQELGIRGTPGVVVNGLPVGIPRNVAELRKLLDDAIAAAE